MIKIGLVDDHEMIVDSLKLLFDLMDDISVEFTTTHPKKVQALINQFPIDILVSDFKMPELDGLQLTTLLKDKFPKVKVLLLTVNENSKDIEDTYHAGASGYLLKKASRSDLRNAINAIANGEIFFGQEALKSILSKQNTSGPSTTVVKNLVSNLTKREIEIIKLLSEELSSNEIAKKLYISPGTVETHRHNILKKLKVKSTIGVIKFGIRAGIIHD